jgi:acyl dehydratase
MTMIEWFDDLAIGMQFKTGEAQITAPDIKRFAAEFDPQPMHLDEDTAAKGFFKGLVASGWHTAAIAMRLLVESRPLVSIQLSGSEARYAGWPQSARATSCIWKAKSKA